MSELYQSLSQSKWDCTYHVVFMPQTTAESNLRANPPSIGTDFPTDWRGKENARFSKGI